MIVVAIYSQISASLQPRTSLSNFGGDSIHFFQLTPYTAYSELRSEVRCQLSAQGSLSAVALKNDEHPDIASGGTSQSGKKLAFGLPRVKAYRGAVSSESLRRLELHVAAHGLGPRQPYVQRPLESSVNE